MATKNFTQFDLRTPLLTSDYIVGYKNDGTSELKTTVQNIIDLVPTTDSSLVQNTSANWNSVYSNVNSNSATYVTQNYVKNYFLPLSGGQVTGNLSAVNVKFTGRVEEGTGTKALGTDSHAEGYETIASGNFGSHAEGYWSVASGTTSHAEGFNTKAIGGSSHAEGNSTIASGIESHAEGFETKAIGVDSHAEGTLTVAYGGASHSEGVYSEAKGLYSHAAGWRATAAYDSSYAWSGDDTLTSNISSTKPRQYFIYAPSGVYIPRGQVGIGTDSQENALTVNGSVLTGDLTGTNIFAKSFTTDKAQTIYQGEIKSITINNATTVNQERLGRLSMLTINNAGATSVLNLSESQNNRFLEGDVVGVWARNAYDFTVKYTPFGGSETTITTFKGGGGYNTGTVALYYKNGTFVVQGFNEQNIKGIASELKIQSLQPNDPGTPFSTVGRGSFVHGLTLNAGDLKFTNGSDHFHLIQNGTGGNWQTLNGGYTYTTQRITQHTLAFRGSEITSNIIAAYGASLTANQTQAPYGVYPETSNNYLAIWTSSYNSTFSVGKIAYFSVSPSEADENSLRKIGFTAASYPAKIISSNAIGTAESNADIPAGQTLPAGAARHFRIQPLNMSVDNWLGAALVGTDTYRSSIVPDFTNSVTNTGEVLRLPGDTLLAPDTQSLSLSSKGGYNTVSMKNGCELVFDLTNTPLLSTKQPFLYEGLPVIVLLSNSTDLSAVNYSGLTPNSAKCQYGLPVNTTVGSPEIGEFTGSFQKYFQQTYDGYIYRSTPTKVIIRLGQQRSTEESRLQKFATPNVDYFVGRSDIGINPATFSKSLPPGGLTAVELNGFRLTGVTANHKFGSWRNCSTGAVYTLPPIMKGGIEFTSFDPVSSSDLQLIVYAGNKDPVHRPVAGMQLFSYERYPNIQPELKETGSVVSKFALGPSCEGFDRDTAVVGFGSTAYHYRSMAIGHRVETLSAQEIAIGIDDSVFRVGLSGLSISPAMLSSNGVDTFLKIKSDNGPLYGLKLQLL